MGKVMVLASGGLDSSLVMAKLLKEGHEVYPIFTDYGQYSRDGERIAVNKVVDYLQTRGGDFSFLHDVLEVKVDIGQRVAASPGRILAFCGSAAIWAFTENWDYGYIAIGIHKGDKDQDSCRVGYESDLNEALKSLTQNRLEIMAPLMGMSREMMALEISKFGIPWEIMYNCYWYPPCGWQSEHTEYLCPGCRRKLEAMLTVGLTKEQACLKHAPNSAVMGRPIARRDWKYE